MSDTMHHLSKCRLISAWQCAKRLWLEINARDEQIVTPNMQRAWPAVSEQFGEQLLESAFFDT